MPPKVTFSPTFNHTPTATTDHLHALLVAGGCCHDYQTQKALLTNGISARANVDWTVVHEGTDRDHKVSIYTNANWAVGYDIVVHGECFGGVTDVPFIKTIAAAHYAGVPAVMLHCSTHSYRNAATDEWRKCVGVSSFSHETRRNFTVRIVQPLHPIMRGFPDNWLDPDDELYKVEVIWPNMIPIARAFGQDTGVDHAVAWINTYGSGRIFSTTIDILDDGDARITWEAVPGWDYSVEASPGIGPGANWTALPDSSMTATNVAAQTHFPLPSTAQQFFRIARDGQH